MCYLWDVFYILIQLKDQNELNWFFAICPLCVDKTLVHLLSECTFLCLNENGQG